ncbi:peptidoglycan-binding domain-containing protein [Dapis sp. BLCC M126]|uniref:peptidoglycan-binding domain-containing protein n=1 Tax=Dapis sp. BLCC M126 TaxID=3400189 RepID=UPI003CEE9BE3
MFTATQTTTTRPTLSLNSTGEDVKYLQTVLNGTVADNSLVVDGIFGNLTKAAVIAFQKRYGLTADGIVGPKTWGLIDTGKIARTTISLGSRGEGVEYLQRRLNGIRAASLVVDGIFGPATQEAVKNFQKSSGLTVDGIVGPKTWEQLELIDV